MITVRFVMFTSFTCVVNSELWSGWLSGSTGFVEKVQVPHSVCAVCTFVCTCTVCGCVSHPGGASVSRIRGGHGHGATPSLGRTGALEHAGMKAWMSPGVFLQVVAPHEALVTHRTVEALFACVRAIVTGELVRSGELLAAACPGTLKGALT